MRPSNFQGNIHIINFPSSTSAAELAELFDEFGLVMGAHIKSIPSTGGHLRLGIVALAPDKPVLEDFVSGVPVNEANPVDSCEIKVAVALQGVQVGPEIIPTARPSLPSDAQSGGAAVPFPR